ncbi:MAG: cell division protein FtsZ, partial [Nitrospinae bacterium]|nr:cell division protein FtsZ [Nitrospinota bacterium]
LDFADVKTIMCGMGKALMGGGIASGENRAIEAAQRAISSPLLDEASVEGARGILINITGGEDLTLHDVNEAALLIQKSAHEDAHIIFGAVVDKSMKEEMRVTVIATGFEKEERQRLFLAPQEPSTLPMKKVVNGPDVATDLENHPAHPQESLKDLADSIRRESPDTLSNNSNFDIPTFLRKHAD